MTKIKIETAYKISYSKLKDTLSSQKNPQNLLIFVNSRIVLEEITEILGKKFIGKDYNPKEHLKKFHSDEADLNEILSESGNLGFFSEKKINLIEYVKKQGGRGIKKEDKKSLLTYVKSPNPDTLLIIAVLDETISPSIFDELNVPEIRIFVVAKPSEQELKDWMTEKLPNYKLEPNVLEYLISHIELSYDSAYEELNKLIIYNADNEIITIDSVNKCIGFSKDYSETDFVKAILSKNTTKAIAIYKNLYLKSDIELRLLGYLNNVFFNLSKLIDPTFDRNSNLKFELKLFTDYEEMLKLYTDYVRNINELKIKKGFDYICRTDLMVKYSKYDRYTVFTSLIHNLTNL